MLSGLILLVIVGAWLAVLVPMALRSHDSSSSLTSVDRFSDAMRVLSRREGPTSAGTRAVVVPGRPVEPAPPAPPVPLAVRRRRTLLALLAAAAVTLVGSLVVSPLLWVHLVVDLLVVAFVVHCRRQAIARARRDARRAGARPAVRAAAGPAARPAADRPTATPRRTAVRPAHVAGIPERMPARPAPLSAPLPAPAARHDEPVVPAAAVGGALGGSWEPVPVPVPTYVTKPVAPPRRPRVLDLTKPGEWSAALQAEDAGLDILSGPLADDELDGILDRRRAVGD